MIWTPHNTDKVLVDLAGTQIPNVISFDDETQECTFIVTNLDKKPIVRTLKNNNCEIYLNCEIVKCTTKIEGAKLVDKLAI